MNDRKPGFYWVRIDDDEEWEPAQWYESGYWCIIEDDAKILDDFFFEIDERRIERNPTITVKGSDIMAVLKRDNDPECNPGI